MNQLIIVDDCNNCPFKSEDYNGHLCNVSGKFSELFKWKEDLMEKCPLLESNKVTVTKRENK